MGCLLAAPVWAAPKNVILLIGDGMGREQIKAAGMYESGVAGTLGFEGLPRKGEVTTYSANSSITDSAAAGTAIATGVKVNNYVVSMAYPGDGSELLTLLEYFKARGKMTGLVTTVYMTHATPATLGAHETDRNNLESIAEDYLTQTRPNVLLGGGANGLTPAEAQNAGYTVVEDRTALLALDTEATAYLSGQFGAGYLPYEYDGDFGTTYPHLAEMTNVALHLLDNDPDGFFLMVEGGTIDQSCHDNNIRRAIHETLEFDNAFQTVMTWAQGRTDTLVIVTADHETGGLTVTANNGPATYPSVTWSSTGHTAQNVAVYSWGPGSERIAGILDNTDFFQICVASSVQLVSPPDGSTLADAQASFVCRAYDEAGLASAALYVGTPGTTLTFSGTGAVVDVWIEADRPDTNLEGDASLLVKIDGLTPHAHTVMQFPTLIGAGPGQIPPGATILSATLQVNCTNTGNSVHLHRLLEAWLPTQVTWNQRATGTAWSNDGADDAASIDPAAYLSADFSAAGWRSLDVTQLVQEWSGGAPNFGFVLLDTGTDGVAFDATESANPPVLTVELAPSSWEAKETVLLSGTSATVAFSPLALSEGIDYYWNVLVTNGLGEQGWAAASFDCTIDTGTALPSLPALAAPADGATEIGLSPTLSVVVGDPDSPTVDVVFFGRGNAAPEDFTLAVLPDTQKYTLTDAANLFFRAQTQWIKDNVTARNIRFVTHEGDISDDPDTWDFWVRADTSMSVLDGVVPYGMATGNHDLPGTYGTITYYNDFFPYSRYAANPWYGGHYPADGNESNFQRITAGGEDWIFLHIRNEPAADVIAWADAVLEAHRDRKAVVTTHSYMDSSGTRTAAGTTIWNGLVVPNDNVFFVLCGHLSEEALRTDYVGDRAVHQILADYQARTNGGDGWLRTMHFSPARGQAFVETYSPTQNGGAGLYEIDPSSQFALDYPAGGFTVIGTVTGVDVSASPGTASIVWPNLETLKRHEWYVKVVDGDGNTQVGAIWRFTTASDDTTAPVIADVAVQNVTDHSATIVWTTDEPANSLVDYGTTDGYGSQAADPALTHAHAVQIAGLAAGTTYHYRVTSADYSGNTSAGSDCTFATAAELPPAAPANLTAAAGDGAVMLDWDDNGEPDLGSYSVHRSITAGGPYTTIATALPQSQYTDDDAVNGTTYYYVVTAIDTSAQESASSNEASATPTDLTPPAAPLGLTATAGDSQVTLDWADNAEFDLAGYEVYRSTAAGGPYTSIDSTNALTSMYVDLGVANGVTYYYVVTAFDLNANESAYSDEVSATPLDTTPPAAPIGLAAAAGDGTVNLTWNVNTEPDLAGYDVYRGTAPGSHPDKLNVALVAGASFSDTTVANGTTYYYMVHAVDTSANSSADSSEASATPLDGTAPAAPANLAATAGAGQVTLDWNDSAAPDFASYSVYRSTTSGGGYGLVASGLVASAYVNTGLANDVAYFYVVTAKDVSGNESGWSNEASATPKETAYDAYVSADPTLTYGTLGGNGYQGTTVASDGLVQTITEAPNGSSGMASLLAEYVLTTAAAGADVTLMELHVAATWTNRDSGDPLVVSVLNVSTGLWETMAASGVFTPTAPQQYIGSQGAIRVRFADTAPIKKESKDIVTVDFLYAHIGAGPVNQPPVAAPDAYEATEDTPLSVAAPGVLGNDSDPENAALSAVEATQPANGVLLLTADGAFTYTPDPDFNGSDSFTYRASDGTSQSTPVTVTITVGAANDAPVAHDDTYTTEKNSTLTVVAPGVLGNDSDIDGDALTAALIAGPLHGGVTLSADGSFVYTPSTDYLGDDSFTYTARDPEEANTSATVFIAVTRTNTAPVAFDDAYGVDEDAQLAVQAPGVLANDTDADGDPLSAIPVSAPLHGTLTLNPNGSFTYTPNADWNGTDSFTYKANDGVTDGNAATVTITVNPVGDVPVTVGDAYQTAQGTPLTVPAPGVLGNDTDADGDALAAMPATGPSHGALTLNTDGSFTYVPDTGWSGTDSFTYKANDGVTDGNAATVTIVVTASSPTISVAAITMRTVPAGKNTKAEATVTVNRAVAGASVTGDWTLNGAILQTGATGTTDANGVVAIQSPAVKAQSGYTFVFTVTAIAATGYVYDPSGNTETSDSVTVP